MTRKFRTSQQRRETTGGQMEELGGVMLDMFPISPWSKMPQTGSISHLHDPDVRSSCSHWIGIRFPKCRETALIHDGG